MSDSPLLLVIDDDANFREIFSAKLGASGFRVETAETGEEGVQKAKSLKPALVLSDQKMPGMPGAQVVSALKSDPETKDLKIVLLSSLATDDQAGIDEHYSQWIGALGFMSKSEDLDQIVGKIKTFLQ